MAYMIDNDSGGLDMRKCIIDGCGRELPSRRSKYCSDECSVAGQVKNRVDRLEGKPHKRKPNGYTWTLDAIRAECVEDSDGCWIWQRALHGGGYGQAGGERSSKPLKMHVKALELRLGRSLNGYALHLCGKPSCCNPDHLYEGDQVDNAKDAWRLHRDEWGGLTEHQLVEAILMRLSRRKKVDIAAHLGVSAGKLRLIFERVSDMLLGTWHILSPEDVRVIYQLRSMGVSLSRIASRFDVDHSTVSRIANGSRRADDVEDLTAGAESCMLVEDGQRKFNFGEWEE